MSKTEYIKLSNCRIDVEQYTGTKRAITLGDNFSALEVHQQDTKNWGGFKTVDENPGKFPDKSGCLGRD